MSHSNLHSTHDSFLQWDPAQVSSYINSFLDQDSISTSFLDNNIEGSILPFITTEHLKEIGILKLSTRLLIKKKISDLINDHYEKNPPRSFNDPEYKLSNVNINNNYVSFESLTLSTVLMKDMMEKLSITVQQHHSAVTSPVTEQQTLDIKRLNDNFTRLKSDLIPVIRLLKDSKPLPTPTLDPGSTTNLDSPTYSISSSLSTGSNNNSNSNTLTETLQDAGLLTSNRNSNPIPSPTQSNRFSSGSLLSLGTGKIVQSSAVQETAKANLVRPKLVESKSTGSASTASTISTHQKPSIRKHSSLIGSGLPSMLPSNTTTPTPAPMSNNEPLKQLRASTEDSCLKILQQAMKRHHIPRGDWSKYVLVICYGDKERILKLAEKPVPIFKELQELGKHPAIMLRQLADTSVVTSGSNDLYEDSRIGDDIPGGTL